MDQAPFSVETVIERVQRSFETTEDGFRGGRAEYGVHASAVGIALTARHWPQGGEEQRDARDVSKVVKGRVSSQPRKARHERAAREQPLESLELTLRTTYVGRGDGQSSVARSNADVPVLADAAQMVSWQRKDHTERLVQTPQGVEQSWEFSAKPAGRDDLRVRVEARGLKYLSETERGLHFADARGLGFGYGHGTWIDAAGVRTAVKAHYVDGVIELAVPSDVVERSAYPAVLDPVVGPEFGFEPAFGSRAYGSQLSPEVAWNGTAYLVVWEDWRSGNPAVYATRVSTSGEVLDPFGKVISDEGVASSLPLAAASNGADYLVAWVRKPLATVDKEIRVTRVSAAGAVLDGEGLSVAMVPGWYAAPGLASNGIDYLVAWNGQDGVHVNHVTASGEVLDGNAGLPVLSTSADPSPALASNGSDYLVVRKTGWGDVYARRVSATGEALDPAEFPVLTSSKSGEAAVVSNGTDYLVAVRDVGVRATRVTAAGVVEHPEGVIVTDEADRVSVGSFDGKYLVVWSTWSDGEIRARASDTSGAFGAERMVVETTARHLDLTSNDAGYLLVWQDSGNDIFGGFLDTAGEPAKSAGFPIATGLIAQSAPSLATNGTDYLLVWEDYRAGGADIYATRVDALGVIQDGAGFPVSEAGTDQTAPTVTSNGTNYLVAYEEDTGWGVDIHAKRVSSAGSVEDQSPLVIQANAEDDLEPAVATNGIDYLVAWATHFEVRVPSDDDPITEINPKVYVRRVPAAGPLQQGPVAMTQDSSRPAVASVGTEYLVVFSGWDIWAQRVASDGQLLGDDIYIADPLGADWPAVSVASNGAEYVVAWEKTGAKAVYVTRLTKDGVVLDEAGVPIAASVNEQLSPEIASNGRDYLVTWLERPMGSDWPQSGELRAATLAFDPIVSVNPFSLGTVLQSGYTPHSLTSRGDRYLASYELGQVGIPRIGARFLGADCSSDSAGDVDGDAVCDGADNCLGVSNFGQEDTDGDSLGNACDGCPSDGTKTTDGDVDGDGTLDCNDACLTDPDKTGPGQCGCFAPDTDSDGDGTADCNDECVADSGKNAPGTCGCGVAETDSDGDGILDCNEPIVAVGGAGGDISLGGGGAGGAEPAEVEPGSSAGSGSEVIAGAPSAQGAQAGNGDGESGCGCRTAVGKDASASGLMVLLAAAGLVAARRRLRAA